MKGSNQYGDYRQSGYGYQQPYYSTGASGPIPPMGAQPFQPMQTTPTFATAPAPSGVPNVAANVPGMLPLEQSYIENILRLNKGKLATVYASFDGDGKTTQQVFKGLIEAAGRDHLILSDPQTGMRYLIPMVFFNYATFDEELEYEYPFGTQPGMTSFPPR